MMNKLELFDKYITGELNDHETDALMELLEDEEIGRELVEYTMETKLFVEYGKKVKSKISPPIKTSKFSRKKQRKSLLPILAVAAMLALAFLGYQYLNERNAAVVSSDSLVDITRDGETHSSISTIKEGDVIHANNNSEISLADGSIISLGSGSKVTVQELVLNKVFWLNKGKITITAKPQEIGHIKVITPDSATEVIGTKFTVNKLIKGTLLEVFKGKVRFSNQDQSIEVGKGSLAYTDPSNGMIVKKADQTNRKWGLWSSLIEQSEDLKFYTSFKKGKHRGVLLSGRVAKEKELFYLENGIITFPDSLAFDSGNELTLFAWVRVKNPSVHAPVFTKGDNTWRMQVNKLNAHLGYGGNETSSYFDIGYPSLNLNKWHLIHQVISENKAQVFIDGVKVDEREISNTNFQNNKPVMIGGNSNKEGFVFGGDIGEVGLFQRALSEREVSEMYELGKFNN